MSTAAADWDTLSWLFDTSQTCACCGQPAAGLMDVTCRHPHVAGARDLAVQDNTALAQASGDILTTDFCRLGEGRFLRCVLEVPFHTRAEFASFSVWASLAPADFDHYCAHFDDRQPGDVPDLGVWLCNSLPLPYTPPVACTLVPQSAGYRPKLRAQDATTGLGRLQTHGLSPDESVAFLQALGHRVADTGERLS